MSTFTLIIVTGHPATGKTTLSRRLANDLGLLCLNKDVIKERMADELGVDSREESRRLGRATYAVLDALIEEVLRTGQTFLVESNFPEEYYSPKASRWLSTYPYQAVQILLTADADVLVTRMLSRITSGERHHAHVEEGDLRKGLTRTRLGSGRLEPLKIAGALIELDTTDFSRVDYPALLGKVKTLLP